MTRATDPSLVSLEALIERLPRLLADMQRASALIDEATTSDDYVPRCVALALIARQFLREAAALRPSLVRKGEQKPEDARDIRRRTGLELDNHHNALMCPYCNPDRLPLCVDPAAHASSAVRPSLITTDDEKAAGLLGNTGTGDSTCPPSTSRLSARWQELFWALPPGEMRHKLRSLEIDIGRMLRED